METNEIGNIKKGQHILVVLTKPHSLDKRSEFVSKSTLQWKHKKKLYLSICAAESYLVTVQTCKVAMFSTVSGG